MKFNLTDWVSIYTVLYCNTLVCSSIYLFTNSSTFLLQLSRPTVTFLGLPGSCKTPPAASCWSPCRHVTHGGAARGVAGLDAAAHTGGSFRQDEGIAAEIVGGRLRHNLSTDQKKGNNTKFCAGSAIFLLTPLRQAGGAQLSQWRQLEIYL